MDSAMLRGRPTSASTMVPSFIPTPAGDLREDAPVLSRVVAAVDRYPLAVKAARTALALARSTVLTCTLSPSPSTTTSCSHSTNASATSARWRDGSEWPPSGRLKVDVGLTGAVTGVAGPGDAAMVCVGTYGRSGLGIAVVGSVAETVLRTAQLPVVLSGPRCTNAEQDVFGHVVVTLDVDAVVLHSHNPARAVERLAADLSRPALILMSTDGTTGLARVVTASVCTTVARTSSVPVVFTRPPQLRWLRTAARQCATDR